MTYTDRKAQLTQSAITPHRTIMLISALGILLIGIIVTAIILFTRTQDCGNDPDCFAKHANSCRSVTMTILDDRGSAMLFEKNCVIIKTIISLNNSTLAAENFLIGQSMNCPHAEGLVPPEVISSITSGTGICYGPLADRLLALNEASSQ